MNVVIDEVNPNTEDVQALVQAHLAFARAVTLPGHVHALETDGLLDAAVILYGARSSAQLVGIGALRELDTAHVELKSMHTAKAARQRGVGRAMVNHLLTVAAARRYQRVSLETGTLEAFAPARILYEQAGFRPCEPFGEYTENPYSVCMTLLLDP